MAVAKTTEKIPSPQEIAGEAKKFTPEEIESLKNIQIRMDQIISQLGRVHLSRIRVNEQEELVKAEISKIEKEEQDLAKTLSDKYGRGSLDIETGTFTPTE
jgi:prolyl oligopeptidase PreP (S9A serine peptidase family)